MATALRHDPIVQLGEFLRTARERAGLTLQQVSNTTKIPWKHLDAIEHGDLSVVPKGPYRRGEVRAFAQAVGADQKVALAQLDEALPKTPIEPTPAPPVEPAEPRSSWMAAISLMVAVAGLIALLLWNRDAASPVAATPDAQPSAATGAPPDPVTATSAPTAPAESTADASAPPDEAPPAPAVSPVLVITSDPPGARVLVDGIGRGTTPAAIRLQALGEHGVRVVRDGYVSEERALTLTTKRPTATVHIELRPAQ